VAHLSRRGSLFWRARRAVVRTLGATCVVVSTVLIAATPGVASPAPSIVITSQSPWVKTGQPFDMTVDVESNVPGSELGVSLSIYTPPNGQLSFDDTISGDTSDETLLSDTQTVQLTSLQTQGSGFNLAVGISAGNYSPPAGPLDLDLSCAVDSCSGVYPLRVQLMDTATGSVLAELVTYVIFVESRVGSRLRVSLVAPIGTAPSTPDAAGGVAPPTGAALRSISSLVSTLSNSSTPVTVFPQPETLQTLSSGNSEQQSVTAGMVSLSDDATAQVLPSPYVWVDPRGMLDSGLSTELTSQFDRGQAVLADEKVQTSGSASVVYGETDRKTLGFLGSSGVSAVVLPSTSVVPVTGRFAGPSVQTFDLPTTNGKSLEAAETVPTLQNELVDKQGVSGVLAANQLLANLALISFEDPDASWLRGVVLVAPYDWSPPAGFLGTLLSGLSSAPIVDPVTLTDFFSQVANGNDGGNTNSGNGWPQTRQLALPKSGSPHPPPAAVNRTRQQLSALQSVVHHSEDLLPLEDLLLCAESAQLPQTQQLAIMSDISGLVGKHAAVISLTSDHTIRLTAQTATIPITLVKQVSYPVTVMLDLSSDKLAFLHDSNPQIVTVTQRIQTIDVDVFARTAGDFPVIVSVRSPSGGLVITSVKFTVRSLSTSVVAIVLTAVAAAVLLAWWGRTLRAGRREKRSRHPRGVHSAA
jgi:hypothetical protein